MQADENPFRALIVAEIVLARCPYADPDKIRDALKLVRSALQYLRTHPIFDYTDPAVDDGRD